MIFSRVPIACHRCTHRLIESSTHQSCCRDVREKAFDLFTAP